MEQRRFLELVSITGRGFTMNKRLSILLLAITLIASLAAATIGADDALASAYIGNSNSGIFHYSGCRYVYRMSEDHKVYFDSRDDAIDEGYRPCKVCRP